MHTTLAYNVRLKRSSFHFGKLVLVNNSGVYVHTHIPAGLRSSSFSPCPIHTRRVRYKYINTFLFSYFLVTLNCFIYQDRPGLISTRECVPRPPQGSVCLHTRRIAGLYEYIYSERLIEIYDHLY